MSSENMNSLSFHELNNIVYQYLERSGFEHSAYVLQKEININNEASTDIALAPSVDLVKLVFKGLQYVEMEANMTEDETDDFIFLEPFDLITKNVHELKQIVEDKMKQKAAEDTQRENKDDKGKCKLTEDEIPESSSGGSEPRILPAFATPPPCGVHSSDILTLKGHSDEVWACEWNPAGLLLASGSGDSTARIWNIEEARNSGANRIVNMCVLKHGKSEQKGKKNDIPTLNWNLDGTLLATGSYDGLATIWHTNGVMKGVLRKHKDRILSVKFNKKGDYLLTGSFDGSVTAWSVNDNDQFQQFKPHSGHVLDVDWRTNRTFASCGTDSIIYVFKIGKTREIKLFVGHKDEVNCVKWDPNGILLASCSDDMTVKVWDMNKDVPLHTFKDHTKTVYTVRWCPFGSGTDNSNTHLLLASGSFDSTVKIWDVQAGRLFHSLNGHRHAVFSIAFSPDGKYLATGSKDKLVNIWSVNEGKIMKTYHGNAEISQVSWSNDGRKIAYSTHKKNVCVADVRL